MTLGLTRSSPNTNEQPVARIGEMVVRMAPGLYWRWKGGRGTLGGGWLTLGSKIKTRHAFVANASHEWLQDPHASPHVLLDVSRLFRFANVFMISQLIGS